MILSSIKRHLRENEITRKPYLELANSYRSMRFFANKVRYGRAFPTSYFDGLFTHSGDPWQYEGNGVSEKRKSLILGLFPSTQVARMLEIGCASGWMTRDLSQHAAKLVAVDCSPIALERAKERCTDCSNIEFVELDLLTCPLEGTYEFVLCAGVLNFFPREAQAAIREKIVATVQPGGRLLLEHLRDLMPGYEVSGRELHAMFINDSRFTLESRMEEDIYEIVLLRRAASTDASQV